jgi:hypothetical protein
MAASLGDKRARAAPGKLGREGYPSGYFTAS